MRSTCTWHEGRQEPSEAVFALVLCLLVVAPLETQAKADLKDCHNISRAVSEGDTVVIPLNTSKMMHVHKWNSSSSTWELVLIYNGKSRSGKHTFRDQLTVSQEQFTVMNASRELQGVYMVTLSLSEKCVALINLTVRAPTAPPSVIPGNEAPAAPLLSRDWSAVYSAVNSIWLIYCVWLRRNKSIPEVLAVDAGTPARREEYGGASVLRLDPRSSFMGSIPHSDYYCNSHLLDCKKILSKKRWMKSQCILYCLQEKRKESKSEQKNVKIRGK